MLCFVLKLIEAIELFSFWPYIHITRLLFSFDTHGALVRELWLGMPGVTFSGELLYEHWTIIFWRKGCVASPLAHIVLGYM